VPTVPVIVSQASRGDPGGDGAPLSYSDVRRTDEDGRIVVQVPVDIRSMALAILAVLASLVVLRWAAAVFVPLLLSLMVTYALAPAVEWCFRRHIPRVLSSAVLLLGLLGAGGGAVYWLSGDANNLLNSLPVAAQKARTLMHSAPGSGPSPLDTVQQAAQHLEQAASDNATPLAARRGVTRVLIEPRPFNVRDYLWSGTIGLAGFLGQMTVVLFLSFFALCAGDTFRRKLVKITGPSLTKKKITIQVLDDITDQIQRYLLVQLLMSALVGLATWLAYWWLGLEYAAVWGLAAGVLNLIPYIGSVAVTGGSALVAFLQFGTFNMALAVGGASLLIHTIVGNLLTPWLTSRASSMNPVVIFAAVLAWGWLWGIWGLLLGIPIMMVIKAICDRVEDLKPIGELMGR
jgi:predicted PurR-regulated permease PerM